MTRANDFHRHAQDAPQYAGLLRSASEKAVWLTIAEEWERMAREADSGHQGGQVAEQGEAVPPQEKPEH